MWFRRLRTLHVCTCRIPSEARVLSAWDSTETRGLLNHIETTKQCLTSLDDSMAAVLYFAWRENLYRYSMKSKVTALDRSDCRHYLSQLWAKHVYVQCSKCIMLSYRWFIKFNLLERPCRYTRIVRGLKSNVHVNHSTVWYKKSGAIMFVTIKEHTYGPVDSCPSLWVHTGEVTVEGHQRL